MIKFFIQLINIPLYYLSYLVLKDNRLWVFGAWHGLHYSDNSKYFFEFINDNQKDITAVWIAKSKSVFDRLKAMGYNVVFAYSLKGYIISARAKVAIISNSKMGDLNAFVINDRTYCVQLWHGIPMKKIGFDSTNKKAYRLNKVLRYIFPWLESKIDVFAVTSAFTRKYFSSAFRIPDQKFSIAGYPRTDNLKNIKIEKKNTFNVLYIPTYRETLYEEKELIKLLDIKQFNNFLKKLNINFYIKLHPQSSLLKIFKTYNESHIKILEISDIYEIMSDFDLLITDYSSIYYDFLLTQKPMILFPIDFGKYTETRGFYEDYMTFFKENMAFTWIELQVMLQQILIHGNDPNIKNRIQLSKLIYKYEDGKSSQRIVKEIFENIGLKIK